MRRGACSVERQQYVMACIKGMENDSDAAPPSVFADMPTISLLEAVVTKDPRWHWLEAAWDASEDESTRELASFVREHRATLANELAGHVRLVVARPGSSTSEVSE
jgi:hypothetical protein